MNKLIFSLLLSFPLFLSAQTAKIKIDTDRTIGEIDPKIYGVFMEPIQFSMRRPGASDATGFNTLYGALYDPSSPLADENGFRKDYIEAMKELRITNMRWPGGNYVAGYNWQDGIGPKEQRPARKDLAWGAIDNNHVGTDEWVALNRSIGSENVICINLGLGTINDARYWVEYCNLDKGTYYADLRTKYGNREPFIVKYWCLGNEVDGSPWIMGHKNAEDYCMANYTLMTSLLGNDREKGTFKTPLFYTFKLFSNNCQGYAIDTYVACDTFNTAKYKGIPFLDITTVYSKEGNAVYINVVNRHKENTITADIITGSGEFTGKAEAWVVTGDSLNEPFTFDNQEHYAPVPKEIKAGKDKISFSFPPHSFTQISVGMKK